LKEELARLKESISPDPVRLKAVQKEIQLAYSAFSYADDPKGDKCPLASHTRRANTRDGLDPRAGSVPFLRGGSILNNRRRILRRGLPYGESGPEASDEGEHGIVLLAVCADLFRQFEFVQQQWINYGLDARAGSDTCPIVGNHSQGADTADPEARKRNGPKAKFVVSADPKGDRPPFIVEGLPQFVETRGGDYFFVPSVTALRMIAQGAVDPT
jgi:deferrochelatase/peroxidase EfeB